MDFNKKQQEFCTQYNENSLFTNPEDRVGITLNVKEKKFPINGLRVLPNNNTSGWYIWAGEEFSEKSDFFKPLHAIHLTEWCPEIIQFLGLPPGYRFLYANDYLDVWFDESLL